MDYDKIDFENEIQFQFQNGMRQQVIRGADRSE